MNLRMSLSVYASLAYGSDSSELQILIWRFFQALQAASGLDPDVLLTAMGGIAASIRASVMQVSLSHSISPLSHSLFLLLPSINEKGVAHWCTLCTLSRSMGMVYTVCTAGLHAPQI